ncbi:MAG: UDP-2,4-diacetamido-2,4,6-trideoxy-beta-L-altropyranose hydrolase [Alteromonadaceae bacterium]|nr:UDP-2,4-diacetamido-2,4,6-trideoxy-beta-L-altropyranose hydrolase [Alteromonadaceae bacterium]
MNLVIIPARAGSKGIPQKNIRFLNGKPLIAYSIELAMRLDNTDVFVSTDSEDIAHIASILGAGVMKREAYFDDDATLDEVIYHELTKLDESAEKYDCVITLQPTSPLLSLETLTSALTFFQRESLTSLLSATVRRHLSWKRENKAFRPLYTERVNRQKLPAVYEENGAFCICRVEHVLQNKTRISPDIEVFEIAETESIDIDTQNDWILAESILKRRNVAIVTNGNYEMGMGHIYRSITLSNALNNDNVIFFSQQNNELGIKKIESLNYRVVKYETLDDLCSKLNEHSVELVINDTLDTDVDYMKTIKSMGLFVVNFEDTGRGSFFADIVFNALFEWSNNTSGDYYGYKYEVLREDIYLFPIKTNHNQVIKNILVGFGGTDIENATLKVLKSLNSFIGDDIKITLVLGVGYRYEPELRKYLMAIDNKNINVVKDVRHMADYLYHSDLVISGNGRMVYETVALGVPIIVLSQNEREMSHIFAKVCRGVGYLGHVNNLDVEQLEREILLQSDRSFAKMAHQELCEKAAEIRQGVNRITNIINQKFDDFNAKN